MLEFGLIEATTEIVDKETIMIYKALIIEPVNNHIEFVPGSTILGVDDFNYVSLAEMKRYPPYLSIETEEIYLFFNVRCINEDRFVLRFGRSLQISGWVNNDFIYCANSDNQKDIKLMRLNQGDNYFFLKLKCIDGLGLPIDFTLRIDPYEALMQSPEWELIRDYFANNVINKVTLMKHKTNKFDIIHFYLIPLDYSDFIKDVSFDFEITDGNNILFNTCVKAYEIISYTHQDDKKNNDAFLHINIRYVINSTLYVKNDIFMIDDVFMNLIETRREWLNTICSNKQELDLQIVGYINQYKYIPALMDDSDYIDFIYNEMIENHQCNFSSVPLNYIEWIKAKGGFYPISFYLKLDNSIYTYTISIPTNYNNLRKYPLIIVFPYFDERPDLLNTMFRKVYSDSEMEDIICMLVNPLGQTMGAYMGDSVIIDCINHVKNNFSIDENRIYGMGYSLGSYTTFTIAQNYPDLFAALFVCSGEYITETIDNIRHIPMIYISSDLDQNFAKQKYDELIKHHDDFNNVVFYNTKYDYHRSLSLYFTHICKKNIIYLLSQRRTQPNQLTIKTQRIKYNKAYGVEILEAKNYREPSSISYEIIDEKINLHLINVNKFRLKISEEFKKRISAINVFKKKIPFECKGNLDFVFEVNDLEINYRNYDLNRDNTLSIQHTNIGILYVFMDKMEIVYSQNENDIISLVQKFQKPILFMQNDPHISVSYPERFTLSLRDALNQNKNLIIIQHGFEAELMKQFRQYYELNFDVYGCSFNGEYHKGEYSIMKLYPHPFNAEYKILLVYANEINQFRKNIYLRRISIPSYTYGLHPLNENSIICFNNKYYSDFKPVGG